VIIPLATDHLDRLATLEKSDGDVGWSRQQFEGELQGTGKRFFVLTDDPGHNILGYGGYWAVAGEAQITNLVIRRDFRRQGNGRRLLDFLSGKAAAEGCRTMTLEVRSRNSAARRLYANSGFQDVGLRRALYQNPVDDAILMEKTL